jgi:N6-L-threonylcarbamoyladenine synthase
MPGKENFDFSFSGLKTAVRLHVEAHQPLDSPARSDIAASAQEAIVDVLVTKTLACAKHYDIPHIYLAGGVAANGPLRERLAAACRDAGRTYHAPLTQYCTDNGAMVACTAAKLLGLGLDDGQALDVFARGTLQSRA